MRYDVKLELNVTLLESCLESKNITGITMYANSFNGEPAVSHNDSSFDNGIEGCMDEQDVRYHVLYSGEGSELLDEYQKTDNEIVQCTSEINKILADNNDQEVNRLSKRATGSYYSYTYGNKGCQC